MMTKKLMSISLIIAAVLFTATVFAAQENDILGAWVTEGGDSCVEISKRDSVFFATITAIGEPTYLPNEVEGMDGEMRVDLNNPDQSLRSQPLVGLELMQDFRFYSGKWVNGSIYDPDSGKTYQCKLTLQDNNILKVRGYIGISLLGRTTEWMRPEAYTKHTGVPLDFSCPFQ